MTNSTPKLFKEYINVFLLSFILVLILVSGLIITTNNLKKVSPEISSTGKIHRINFETIELADSEQERQFGLMNRKELCDTCSMLFVFDDINYRSFWMENTYIPLDIIFIDETGKIVNISNNAVPLDTSVRYNSTAPAKYVLEVNAGFSKQFDLKPGDQFKIDEMIAASKPISQTPEN